MTQKTSNTSASRVDIIQTVKTPLGFFTLVVLVVEILLGISAKFSQGTDRTYLIIGMLVLIFLLVIVVACLAFFRPEALSGKRPSNSENQKLSPTQKIAKYRELIEQETKNSLLMNFYVPDGYKSEVSAIDKFAFGFCYPQDWSFTRFAQQTQYGTAVETSSADKIGFARNMNLMINDIGQVKSDLDEIYEHNLKQGLTILPRAKLIFKETDFIFQGLSAIRHRIDWVPQDEERRVISLYQIQVADKKRNNLYTISFSTLKEDFEKARPTFDNIVNTFRV